MSGQYESSIVRIRQSSRGEASTVVGVGFLVDRRHIITCSHVVNLALGRELSISEQPIAPVYLDFFVAPAVILQAQVIAWQSIQPDERGDIAVLELTDGAELPREADPAKLLRVKPTTNLWEHSARVFGFPELRKFGVWTTECVIRGCSTRDWFQLESTQSTGYHIQPGFSGGPVWDDTFKAVVGMVVAADENPQLHL